MKSRHIIIDILLIVPFLLVLSTVFVVNKEVVNGVVAGKYFWFYYSMGIVSFSMLIWACCGRTDFRFTWSDFLLLLLVGNCVFSSFVINDASQNTTKFVLLSLLVVFYFNIRLFFVHGNTRAKGQIVLFIVLTGLIEAVWGVLQLYNFIPSGHSLFKLTGSFFNPGPYAGYLAVVFPLALHLIRKRNAPVVDEYSLLYRLRYNAIPFFATVTCIAILLVLPASMSRAAWVAVLVGSLVVLIVHYSWRCTSLKSFCGMHRKKKIVAGIVTGILLFAALVGMYVLKKDSADGRFLMWKIAWQTVKQHPFGVGLGNFSGSYGDVQADYFASGKGTETEKRVAGSPEYGFNEYLQIAVESGILALILFLAIVFLSLRSLAKQKQWGMVGAFVSLLLFAFFSYPFSVLPFLLIFVFLLAAGGSDLGEQPASNKSCSIVLASLGVVVSGFCLYKEFPVYRAYKKWETDRMYYNAGLYKELISEYDEILPLLNDRASFLFEYARILSKSERYTESNKILDGAMRISCDPMLYNIMGKNYQALKEYERAEACFIKASHITPNRLYPFYLLTKLYHEMGLWDKVRETATMVQTKEPKVYSPAISEMREEIKEIADQLKNTNK